MKDRRIVAMERVLARRRRLDKTLADALAAQRHEQAALQEACDGHRRAASDKADELAQQDRKIDATMGGTASFRADELILLHEWRAVTRARWEGFEATAVQAEAAVAEKDAQIRASRDRILKNRARIDIYDTRRAALVRAIDLAAEDAQDEETSENRRPSVLTASLSTIHHPAT
jgi:hypothetical protein